MKKERKAFTLVELVITITIIVILASISFLNIGDYTKNARDTVRISDLDNIVNVMNLSLSTGDDLIKPDNIVSENVKFQETGDLNWIEGEFGEQNFAKYSNLSNLPKDPKLKNNYKYFQSEDGDYYLLEAILENGEKIVRTNINSYREENLVLDSKDDLALKSKEKLEEMEPKSDGTCEDGYYLWKGKCRIPGEMWLEYDYIEKGENIVLDFHGNVKIIDIDWGDNGENNCPTSFEFFLDYFSGSNKKLPYGSYGYTGITYKNNGIKCVYLNSKKSNYVVKVKGFAEGFGSVASLREKLIRVLKWDLKRMGTTSLSHAFYRAYNLISLPDNLDTSLVINMSSMFEQTGYEGRFFKGRFFNQDLGDWDVSRVETMSGMFSRSSFNSDISKWNVKNVLSMFQMFSTGNGNKIFFKQDISGWDLNENISCYNMFYYSTKNIKNDSYNKNFMPEKCRK